MNNACIEDFQYTTGLPRRTLFRHVQALHCRSKLTSSRLLTLANNLLTLCNSHEQPANVQPCLHRILRLRTDAVIRQGPAISFGQAPQEIDMTSDAPTPPPLVGNHSKVIRHTGDFQWQDVALEPYKATTEFWQGI